jgi:hypothetical protein
MIVIVDVVVVVVVFSTVIRFRVSEFEFPSSNFRVRWMISRWVSISS